MMRNHISLLLMASVIISWWSVESAIVCPPSDAYSPCSCGEIDFTGTIYLNCGGEQLDDARVSEILAAFLSSALSANISPLEYIYLWKNQLTRTPSQIRHFPHRIVTVDLSDNNITSIEHVTFNDAALPQSVILQNNLLATIEPGAFKAESLSDRGSMIFLRSNKLTRFESTVFKSVLEKMASYDGFPLYYVEISNNPIECDCHLAWLIRDNRHLLPAVYQGTCSNGTTFKDLDPKAFAYCPSFTCPLGYDGHYADPSSYSSYYICYESTAFYYKCPADLVFNSETSHCVKNDEHGIRLN